MGLDYTPRYISVSQVRRIKVAHEEAQTRNNEYSKVKLETSMSEVGLIVFPAFPPHLSDKLSFKWSL